MPVNARKVNLSAKPIIVGCVTALCIGIAVMMLLTSLTLNQVIEEAQTKNIVLFTLMLSGFVGTLTARLLDTSNAFQVPASVCAIYICTLLIVGMLIFDGGFEKPILGTGMIAAGSIAACCIRIGGKKGKRKKHRHG